MRVAEGGQAKTDKNGTLYHLHVLAGSPPASRPDPTSAARPAPRLADPENLHQIYSALLSRLPLSDAHQKDLQQRGLSKLDIDSRGYKTLPAGNRRCTIAKELQEHNPDELLTVPGFVVKEGKHGRYVTINAYPGLLIPVRNRQGRIVAVMVRADNAEGDKCSRRYSYLSSTNYAGPGPGSPVHVPLDTMIVAKTKAVRITEGVLKADVATAKSGQLTLGLPGVSNWALAVPVLRELEAEVVTVALDADARTNAKVARAVLGCLDTYQREGFKVRLERWDLADGKGIDDLLHAGKRPEVLEGDAAAQAAGEIAAAAGVKLDAEGAAPLDRLWDVLREGGAASLFADKELMKALARLALDDPAEFASVRARMKNAIPPRDLQGALRPFLQELAKARPPAVTPEGMYKVAGGCIIRERMTPDGVIEVPLANFDAHIVEQMTIDDGVEKKRTLIIEGTLATGEQLGRAEVPADQFPRLEWIVPSWGTRAVVYAGQGTRDHLRAAMQLLSGDVPDRVIYAHTGWREIGGQWFYLHAGGAIGPDGMVDVDVVLPDSLGGFVLPEPPEGATLMAAVQASLRFLDLAPDHITFPLLADTYRAALGDTDHSVHLVGPTGTFKTETATLCQQHYGLGFEARKLPCNWSSTANALERLAFAAKDALIVVDDFAPTGGAGDVQRLNREADRIFRAQGNHSSRLRMRADTTLQHAKPPRGLILSTGEDTPRGQSLRARLLTIELSKGDVSTEKLTACQRDGAGGLYARAMAAFLQWVAPRYKTVRGGLREEQAALREKAKTGGQHARTPTVTADLCLGLQYFLDFAKSKGAITEAEHADLRERGWRAFTIAAEAQGSHIAAAEPAGMFLRLLAGVLVSGRGHVVGSSGLRPVKPDAWGWRLRTVGQNEEWQPQGHRFGWLDGDNLYLEPEASFAEVQRLAGEQGEALPTSAQTLRKRLKERGRLASFEEGKTTTRRTLEGVLRTVIHMRADCLAAPKQGEPGDEGDGPQNAGENLPVSADSSPGYDGAGKNRESITGGYHRQNGTARTVPPVPPVLAHTDASPGDGEKTESDFEDEGWV
jgi:hypothetical protein